MNTSVKAPGGVSSPDLTRELDVLLAPLSKHLRYPLPVPEHLASTQARYDYSSPLPLLLTPATAGRLPAPGHYPSPEGIPEEEEERRKEEMIRAAKQQALTRCAAMVEGLQLWQDRVEEGLQRGLDSRKVETCVLEWVSSMRAITKSVQVQSNNLSHNASVLMARKARLVQVQEELQRSIQHFTRMEDLCREAEDSTLTATGQRFPQLFQDLESEMRFLSRNTQFKSAKMYATKLAVAQEKTAVKLMNAIKASFTIALRETSDVARRGLGASSSPPSSAPAQGLPPPPHHHQQHQQQQQPQPPLEASLSSLLGASNTPEGVVGHSAVSPSGAPLLSSPEPSKGTAANLSLLDVNSPAESFARTLRFLNDAYMAKVNHRASLRRMAELRSSLSYTGAEAFGEEPLNTVEEDPLLLEVLRYYYESRVSLVGSLLRGWLAVWCKADALRHRQQQQEETGAEAESAAPQGARSPAGEGNEAQTPERVPAELPVSLDASPSIDSVSKSLTGSLSGVTASTDYRTPLPQLADHVCVLLEVCFHEEKRVLDEVWLRPDFVSYVFPKLVGEITEVLYHAFRAHLVRVDDLEELAATVERIQVLNLRQANNPSVVEELSRLWVRMIQDVQERIIFRTSVCLRQDVGRGHPTKQLVAQYTAIITAGAMADQGALWIPGVQNAVYLLSLLYTTLEFSVFSVFAEEAVKTSLQLIKELGRMLSSQTSIAPWAEAMSLAAQLMHLLYVRNELTHIDANITVVEKSLDFAKLARQRKLEIVQSSKESKTTVEREVQACATRLSQCLCETVAKPMTGTRRMAASAVAAKMKEMEDVAAKGKYLVLLLIRPQHPPTQEALAQAVDRRVDELTHEVAEMHLSAEAGGGDPPPPPS